MFIVSKTDDLYSYCDGKFEISDSNSKYVVSLHKKPVFMTPDPFKAHQFANEASAHVPLHLIGAYYACDFHHFIRQYTTYLNYQYSVCVTAEFVLIRVFSDGNPYNLEFYKDGIKEYIWNEKEYNFPDDHWITSDQYMQLYQMHKDVPNELYRQVYLLRNERGGNQYAV